MNSSWGRKLHYSLFGESHGKGVGITIHGLPSGIRIDMHKININLERRKTGKQLASKRREADNVTILSGEKDGYTSGSPLTFFLENQDVRSDHYLPFSRSPRPSHTDFVQLYKYGTHADLNGSGHLSARLTAPIVIAGTLLSGLDAFRGLQIFSELTRVGPVSYTEERFGALESLRAEEREALRSLELPILEPEIRALAEREIAQAISDKDSLGSAVSVSVTGVPAGLGEPFFYSVESVLSQLFFSIPAVKAVEFGLGKDFAASRGSLANDPFVYQQGSVRTSSNHSGGINGGISNGMPIRFQLSFRPAPSIGLPQHSVDLLEGRDCQIRIEGRHDACPGIRAIPIIEAMVYMGLYELI